MRQFRRYLPQLEGIRKGKGGHYYVVGPVTPARLARIREQIAARQSTQRKRGGETRRIYRPATSRKAGILTIEGIMVEFGSWRRRVDLEEMDVESLDRLMDIIDPVLDLHEAACKRWDALEPHKLRRRPSRAGAIATSQIVIGKSARAAIFPAANRD